MTNARILELLKIERECVSRNGQCDRDCAKCDLVQIDSDLIEMYDNAIELYQKIVEGRAVVLRDEDIRDMRSVISSSERKYTLDDLWRLLSI